MGTIYNVYCDESCHLEHDGINDMILGAVWCPQDKLKEVNKRIRKIKEKYGVRYEAEIKWTKIGPVKKQLYLDIVDYFFDDDDLHFRGLIVPDKKELNHDKFNQTYDDWYYKMYFDMLKVIFAPKDRYEVYIDVKDTNSYHKAQKLHEICCNNMYDFSRTIIRRVQPIRSQEVSIMQVVDILIGALGYQNRIFDMNVKKSETKQDIIKLIKERSGYQLTKSTLYREEKFNLLRWEAK